MSEESIVIESEVTPSAEEGVKPQVLPLWERCMEAMRAQGIHFGQVWEMAWLTDQLKCEPNCLEFGIALSAINDHIMKDGYYLTARDMSGRGYRVCSPEQAEQVSKARVSSAFRELRRSIALNGGLLGNPTANLSESARLRIENNKEKNEIRLALMARVTPIAKYLKAKAPKLLARE